MRETDVRQRMESFLRMPRATAIIVAAMVLPACSSSGLKANAHDAGAASGGEAGSTISSTGGVCISCFNPAGECDASPSCNPGDIPTTSDEDCLSYPNSCYVNQQCGQVITCRREIDTDVDAGGSNGDSGAGGTGGLPLFSTFFPLCNPGDQQVASGIGLNSMEAIDLPGNCPAERECYSVNGTDGQILCVLPQGVHCDDQPQCNPGDTQIMSWGYPYSQAAFDDVGCPDSSRCYQVSLCYQFLLCRSAADAGVHAAVCSGTWSDGIPLQPPNASVDGGDAETAFCCGDGIVEPGEECDFGALNGVPLDANFNPSPNGQIICERNCLVPCCGP